MISNNAEDHELVKQFQEGSELAFNYLVLKHRKGIYMTAVGLLGNSQDADDIAQEVFIRAYNSIREFRGDSAFYTWIYRITVNLCLNQLRGRKIKSFFGLETVANLLPDTRNADAPTELDEFSTKARKAIGELPEKQRAVFILRHFRDLSHAEIAVIMDRDVGTIKANYFQAIQKLKTKLGPYVEGKE